MHHLAAVHSTSPLTAVWADTRLYGASLICLEGVGNRTIGCCFISLHRRIRNADSEMGPLVKAETVDLELLYTVVLLPSSRLKTIAAFFESRPSLCRLSRSLWLTHLEHCACKERFSVLHWPFCIDEDSYTEQASSRRAIDLALCLPHIVHSVGILRIGSNNNNWFNNWLMELNIRKCKTIRVSKTSSNHHNTYHLSNIALGIIMSYKCLGMRITKNLSWTTHVEYIINNDDSMLDFLRRNFSVNFYRLP